MKTRYRFPGLCGCLFLAVSASTFAQGPLTPTGPPAPTMRSLDQIEARIPLAGGSTPITISQSGSYYLTGDLNVTGGDAITITVNRVTLDLNGYSITSSASPAAGTAINLAGSGARTNITIVNGRVGGGVSESGGNFSGNGFASGIDYAGNAPFNVRVTGVSVSGCLNNGINLSTNNSTMAESCAIKFVGGTGITADSIVHCTAYICGADGLYATAVSDSYAEVVADGRGIFAATASNCTGLNDSTGGYGVYVSNAASNCLGRSSGGNGLFCAGTACNCYGFSTGTATGLYAAVAANGCSGQSSSGTGLAATNANNSSGNSSSGVGMQIFGTATGCTGTVSGAGSTTTGLTANNAINCKGQSVGGIGLQAIDAASNCSGTSNSGTGLDAALANTCRGTSTSGTGLHATIANSCIGTSTSGTGVIATNKYNMP